MLYLGGVGLAFFLILLLLGKRNKSTADLLLTGWIIVITIHLLLFYFSRTGTFPQLLGADFPLPLVHGPFLFLYTITVTNRASSWKYSILHFIPALMVAAYATPFYFMPTAQKVEIFRNNGVGYEVFNALKFWATCISGVVYVLLTLIILRRHRKQILQEYSNTERVSLRWLQYLAYWLGFIWLEVLFGNDDVIFTTSVLFIIFIGYFGIRQTGIFHPITENLEPADNATSDVEEKPKYQKSGLTAESSEVLHQNLSKLMAEQKLFRKSELSLADLATALNTQPNHLSRVINEREGKNFYDYINNLRIEEFKVLAADPDNRKFTLMALAEECGFNSKSSFNRYFKKATGQSPSEFMREAVV